MISKVFAENWIYGEYGDDFGTPRNAFFTAEEADAFAVFVRQELQRI